ncbi:MAG: DNA ligase D [Bacteroidales bacterium]
MDELKAYNEKRKFDETPEPAGHYAEAEEKNRFVVQRHLARREHYDFRLQVGNVLVSWAIPKKPVPDPEVKRLAMKTEDHPLEYIHFEGNIPKGNYGAGTVMVWDIGYYYLESGREVPTKGEMMKKIAKGSMKIYLQGTKLKGYFNLVRSGNKEKEEWFFMKAKEDDEPADQEELSALTGRTMEEIRRSTRIWDSEKSSSETAGNNSEKQKQTRNQKVKNKEEQLKTKAEGQIVKRAEKQEFPGFIKPMLATLTNKAFSDDKWIYELKYDGYRVIAARNSDTKLYSRNGNDFTKRYHLITKELSEINARFIIDGELCYVDDSGRTDFQKLQDISHEQEKLHYYVFDLLWLNGHDLKDLPLLERKKLLKVLLKKAPPHVHYPEHIEKEGEKFFHEVEKKDLEGIIAKRADGKYHPGARSDGWLKIKTAYRQEMIICGYIESDKKSRLFSSLLCAVHEKGKFVYTGRVGTGFSEKKQEEILSKAKKLETKDVPVINPPSTKKIHWLKPEMICEVSFSSWTKDRIMRHPRFIALRSDKKPELIQIEKPKALEDITETKMKFTNLKKKYWPDEGFTKGDVINYYREISGFILPYLIDRPQSLYRTPEGIKEKGFFHKNIGQIAPGWVQTIKIKSSRSSEIEYLLCQDKDTLLYMANLGCIEINPWSSSLPDLDKPDFMIFDLDPMEVEFSKLVEISLEFKKLFDQLKMPAYCKTSGSRGIHIFVPVIPKYSYEQVQNFVKLIESHIHKKFRNITSFERSPSKRKGKIYLDYLQNGKGKTMSSVYSIRPRPGATISTPIEWDELNKNLDPRQFHLGNIRERLAKTGDVWKGFFEQRINIEKVL